MPGPPAHRMKRVTPQRLPRTPQAKLAMDTVVEHAIELLRVWPLVQHCQIVTIFPVRFLAQLSLHSLVKSRTGERIRDGNPDVVRHTLTHHFERQLHVVPQLARVTEL